ncbi:MAG: hypothetical protein PUK20_03950 [Firmicutes bacterium]|nr:hypothetical protein [Bacillota bacterium]MDY4106800.1 hypothetical protein [Oscillospiraceae bacterium]
MPKRYNIKPINVDYLKLVVAKSGKTVEEFCESIGRSDSAYYNAISRGTCQDVILKMISSLYKCDYDKLILQEPESVQPEQADTPNPLEPTGNSAKDIEYIKQMVYCIMESNDRTARAVQDLNALMAQFLK